MRFRSLTFIAIVLSAVACGREEPAPPTSTGLPPPASSTTAMSTAPQTVPPEQQPRTTLPDACTLLTAAEAEAILGDRPNTAHNTFGASGGGGSACHYNSGPSRLSVIIRDVPPGRTPLAMYDQFVVDQTAVGNPPVAVEGVGEQAAWVPALSQLSVFDSRAAIIVVCSVGDEAKSREAAKRIAATALSRVPAS